MKLLEIQQCKKGITLDSQLVDLLSILDENISIVEQDKKINNYILDLQKKHNDYIKFSERGLYDKYCFLIETVLSDKNFLSLEQKEMLKLLYLENSDNICDSQKMIAILKLNGFDENIHQKILKDLKNIDFTSNEGVLSLTPEKVREFYSHLFKDGKNTYDRVTFDKAGKFSSYVAVDGKTYANERLEKMIKFCEKHGMKSKINTFMMYCDFPKSLENHLQSRVDSNEITEERKKEIIKESLLKYVEHIGKTYGDRIDTVDIFNELIYDPKMVEDGFEEQNTYHIRREGWQKYLDIRDLCDIALVARKLMSNTTFTYNDMNWVNPQKRREIIKVVKEIQQIEQEYRHQGKLGESERLIDNVGFESHLTTNIKPKQIEKAFEEVTKKLNLPIEITELDCARTGENPESIEEINKQKQIFYKIYEMIKKYNVKTLTIWSPNDQLSFMNEKCNRKVYASVLDDNFEEKDIEPLKKKSLFSRLREKLYNKQKETLQLPETTNNKDFSSELQSMVQSNFTNNKSELNIENIEKDLDKRKEDDGAR